MSNNEKLSKMTKGNLQRYVVARCRRYLNNPTPERREDIMNDLFYAFSAADYCWYCPHEDIGYCGLRSSEIDDYSRQVKFCIPSLIRYYDAKNRGGVGKAAE